MKYDLHKIMCRAWALYRKGVAAFAECLHRAWSSAKAEPINAQRIVEAQQTAGIEEECRTWADWKKQGREVLHGAKAAFQVLLIYASKGDGQTLPSKFLPCIRNSAVERIITGYTSTRTHEHEI